MDKNHLYDLSGKGCRAMPSRRTDAAESMQRKSPGKLQPGSSTACGRRGICCTNWSWSWCSWPWLLLPQNLQSSHKDQPAVVPGVAIARINESANAAGKLFVRATARTGPSPDVATRLPPSLGSRQHESKPAKWATTPPARPGGPDRCRLHIAMQHACQMAWQVPGRPGASCLSVPGAVC